MPAAGGGGFITILAAAGCAWSVTSNSTGALPAANKASGHGNGLVHFTIPANPSRKDRSAILTVNGVPFTITQR